MHAAAAPAATISTEARAAVPPPASSLQQLAALAPATGGLCHIGACHRAFLGTTLLPGVDLAEPATGPRLGGHGGENGVLRPPERLAGKRRVATGGRPPPGRDEDDQCENRDINPIQRENRALDPVVSTDGVGGTGGGQMAGSRAGHDGDAGGAAAWQASCRVWRPALARPGRRRPMRESRHQSHAT
jgi:hypothetical protein